jgi:predicted transcriptional regulator
MDHVMSVVDRLAGNPNSGLDVNNVVDTITKLQSTITAGYQRVLNLETSTSLTAAVTPAETAVEVTASAPETATAVETPAEAPVEVANVAPKATAKPTKAASKKTESTTVKSTPAPKEIVSQTKAATEEATAKPTEATNESAAPIVNEDKDVATAESMIKEHGSARAAAIYIEQNRTRGRKTAWQKIIEERADKELRSAAKNHKKINADGLASAIANAQQDRKDKKSKITDAQAAREYSLKTTGYPFAHIDRKPVMDPEKALGAKITCLIDGVQKTMMSRYIDAKYAMSPEEYIAHFDLSPDYPMTADLYRNEKRRLAEEQGLGQRGGEEEAAPVVEQVTPATTKRRSRQRAAA